jgi:transposase
MEYWQERGLAIAQSNTVKQNRLGWQVPSQSGNGTYIVNIGKDEPFCSCQHYETTHNKCQHIYAVEFIIEKLTRPDGTEVLTKTMKVTYSQDWEAYNEAQTNEQRHFVRLLRELCDGIPQPEQTFGRPRLPLADVIFGLAYRTYFAMSGRRFTSELKEAQNDGLITNAGHYNSAFRYLENPELTPIIKSLIERSASVLKSVETDFAVDSSGFATTTYDRWFDYKWKRERSEAKWIKTHLMCGVNTHIVTSVEITPLADSPQLPKLVETTSHNFTIREVSADKAYSGKSNLHAIDNVNATAYIPFKTNAVSQNRTQAYDSLWDRMLHYYNYNRNTFWEHYHKRSNVETVFSMIKTKFGTNVKAKTPTAQVNEVLLKILCHNICVLIMSMYELNLQTTFLLPEVKEPIALKMPENRAS